MTDFHDDADLSTPKPVKKRVQREWKEQETDAEFLNHALPLSAYWTSIDQGRAANLEIGRRRKKRGIRSGIPDILIVWNGITLWIERKVSTAENRLGYTQRITAEKLTNNGHKWARANTTYEVEEACRDAGIPLRASYGEKPPAAPRKRKASKPRPQPQFTMGRRAVKRIRAAGIFT